MKWSVFSVLGGCYVLSSLFLTSCGSETPPAAVEVAVDLGEDVRLVDGQSITLDAGAASSYLWSTGATTSTIDVDTTGDYWVEVKAGEATARDTIHVELAWRTVKVTTELGNMQFWLHPETPLHKEGFLKLVNQGYFDDHTFNRVINQFVIQGGCPDLPDGFTDTSLFVDPEFHPDLTHRFGALGGGRDDNPGKRTNICQFYIVDKADGPYDVQRLNNRYTIFGKTIDGLDVVQAISEVETNDEDAPLTPIHFSLKEEAYTAAELKELFGFDVP